MVTQVDHLYRRTWRHRRSRLDRTSWMTEAANRGNRSTGLEAVASHAAIISSHTTRARRGRLCLGAGMADSVPTCGARRHVSPEIGCSDSSPRVRSARSVASESAMSVHAAMTGVRTTTYSRRQRQGQSGDRFPACGAGRHDGRYARAVSSASSSRRVARIGRTAMPAVVRARDTTRARLFPARSPAAGRPAIAWRSSPQSA
jgi:hypothetical protein